MKRAALIVTDAGHLMVSGWELGTGRHVDSLDVLTSEQLLADLRETVEMAEAWTMTGHPYITGADERVARVRALLPEENDDE